MWPENTHWEGVGGNCPQSVCNMRLVVKGCNLKNTFSLGAGGTICMDSIPLFLSKYSKNITKCEDTVSK